MNNEGDKPEGNKDANAVSNKSKEDALLLSLESVDDSWVLDSGAHFMLHLIKVISLIMSKGIFFLFIWGIMNPVILL